MQHSELLISGASAPKLPVPQSPEDQELAVALLQEATAANEAARPQLTVPVPPSPKPELPRLHIGVDVTSHLAR